MGKIWDHQTSFETRSYIGGNISCGFPILNSAWNVFSSRPQQLFFVAFNQVSEFAVIGGIGHLFFPIGIACFYTFHSVCKSTVFSSEHWKVTWLSAICSMLNRTRLAWQASPTVGRQIERRSSIIFQTQVPGTLTHPPTPKKWKRDGSRAYVFVCYFIWFYVGVQHVFLSVDVFLGCYFSVFLPKSVHGFLVWNFIVYYWWV